MSDMGMSHEGHGAMPTMPGMSHEEHMKMMKEMKMHPGMHHSMSMGDKSGWADRDTPTGAKALEYSDLRFKGVQQDLREPTSEIVARLGGNMERYIWTINGKKHEDLEPFHLRYGDRVRIKFINETMMAHPMHLHGMFVQLENGASPEKRPNKHTLIIPPGQTVSVLLTADEEGEWAFHCHLLYHMLSGMMTSVVVSRSDAPLQPTATSSDTGGHQHAH